MVKQNIDPTGERDTYIIAGFGVITLAVAAGLAWTSLHLAAWWTDSAAPAMNPVALVGDLARQRVRWTSAATTAAVVQVVALFAVMLLAIMLSPKKTKGGKRQRSDRSARYMARPADYRHLTEGGARAKARQLGFLGAGLPLGETLSGKALFTSWEDTVVLIAGPRTMKTTAYAVPCIQAAPGACIVTSNKRDVFDVTNARREQTGRTWLFDPQGVAGVGTPTWFWDPLSYVAPRDEHGSFLRRPDGHVDASDTRAERLAAQFVVSMREDATERDAYFDNEAENLIGLLLLAAALDSQPVTQVYLWMTEKDQDDAVQTLRENGFPLHAKSLFQLSRLPDKQKEGVYGGAMAFCRFLRSRDVTVWVTNNGGQRFDPRTFAQSTDTLYSLSHDGPGSVGPLVAALTMAVLDAVEAYATTQPQGRLSVPCVVVLDEAANVCKLRDLDAKYSHYGSRGIVPVTILQSWHQGAQVWGDHGIEKLWSAANCKVYGGGVDDDRFLSRLSTLIGQGEMLKRTVSVGDGKRTTNKSRELETILSPAELRELPAGRAILFASGTPAMLMHPVPYFDRKAAA